MRLAGVIFFVILFNCIVAGQTDSAFHSIEPFDFVTEDESASFIEYITDSFSTGLDINRAVVDDFLELPGFDEQTAEKILTYRKTNRKFYSTGELYIIPGINHEVIRRYFPLFRVKSKESSWNQFSGNLSFRQEKRFNHELPASYPGNEFKQRMKSEFRYGDNVIAKLITEKDPGELKFADHVTGFITWKQAAIFRNITAGSYILRSPSGLLSGSPYYIPLGSQSLRFTNNLQVRGFSSSEENRYLLGGTATIELSGVTFTPFYSQNHYDGSLGDGATAFYLLDGGYHRNTTERRLRDGLLVKSTGISASINNISYFGSSLTFYHQQVGSASNSSVNNFASASVSARADKYAVMGELVFNRDRINYVVHAARKAPGLSPVGIYFRYLNDNSLPVYANPYRESSYQHSETGGGLYFRITPLSVPLDFTTDIFSYKRHGGPLTTSGFRIMITGEKKLSHKSMLKAVYSLRSKDNLVNSGLSQRNSIVERHSLSVLLQQKVTPILNLKNRLIYNHYRGDFSAPSDGFAFISELYYTAEEQYGLIAGYAGFGGRMIETASYFSERIFLDYGTLKALTGAGNYLYTSFFAKLPLNFTLSVRTGWENKTDYDDNKNKNISGSLTILYEW